MRSLVLLVVGLIAGSAIGAFSTTRFKQRNTPPAPITQPAATKPAEPASPFAPIEKESPPVAQEPNVSDTSPRNDSTTTLPAVTEQSLSQVKHYHQLQQHLQFIDTASSEQLETLSSLLNNDNDRSPFTRAMNAAVYQRWAEVDLNTALDYAIAGIKNQSNRQYSRWAHESLTILASVDPDYVREHIESIDTGYEYSELKHALYAGLASNNPEQLARQYADANSPNSERFQTLSMAFDEWARTDPQSAWNFIQTELDSQAQSIFSNQVMHLWYEQNPATALEEIEKQLSNNTLDQNQSYVMTEMYAEHLSKTDPNAAYQWIQSQLDTDARVGALMNLVHNWDPNDPTGLQSFVDQMDPADRDQVMPMAISSMAFNMARTDPASAIAWAEQLPEEQRVEAHMNIIGEWAMTSPDAAAEWLFNLPESEANNHIIAANAGAFLHGDPETAKRFFARMPTDIQSDYIEQMVHSLAQQSPEAAQQWLNEQSNSEVQLIGSITLNSMDPNSDTTTLLNQIGSYNNRRRTNLLMSTIMQRMGSHEAEVKQWIASTTLLADDEREMVEQITAGYNQMGNPMGMPYLPSVDYYINERR